MSVKSINRQYKEQQKNDEWRASIHQYMQQQCNNQKLHVESEYAQFYQLIWSDNQNNKAFDFVAMKIESFDQSEARNRQRIIRPWEKVKHTQSAHSEFTHQVWVKSFVGLYAFPCARASKLNQQICISPAPGRSSKLTHTGVEIDTMCIPDRLSVVQCSHGHVIGVAFFRRDFSGVKRTCWTTGSWRSCLSLEVVSSIPTGSTIIYRFLCGFICVSLCQSIKIKPTNMYVCMYVCIYIYIYIRNIRSRWIKSRSNYFMTYLFIFWHVGV